MKGWVTADVKKAIELLKQYGQLRLINDYDLVIETEDKSKIDALSEKLTDVFGEEVWVEHVQKKRLA